MIRARLRLFGEPSLTVGPDFHASPVDLPQHVQILLVYLTLHPNQPIDRRKLAFILWSDTTEATALRNLRQHLYRLRQILTSLNLPDDILVSKGGRLHFSSDPSLWIDVLQFERQITDQRWQIEAIELYRDDLLAGYEVDWLQSIRTRLREQYLTALRHQITIANMQRNYSRALHYAARLLQATPLRESSHRIYMEALYFSGQRVRALQQFAHLKRLLKRTLKAEPMPQTVALYQQIQNGTLPGDIPPLISSSQQAPQDLKTITQISASFVGRRAELAELDEALARALNGWGGFILIEGESGLGKTHLLHTWQQARAELLLLFRGQSQTIESGIPCAPILETLQRGHSQIDWQWFPAHSPWLGELRSLLLDVDDSVLPPETTHRPAILPTVDKLGQFILTLAAQATRPVGLLIDDLHNADEATWQLLAFLGRRCSTTPLLIVGTYQPNLLPTSARRLIHSLQRHRQVETTELWPLSPADAAKLTEYLLRHLPQPDKSFINQVYRVTEGNPFFITEFLKSTHLGTGNKTSPSTIHPLPKTVRTVISAQLNRLTPESKTLLAVAAAIGRTFNFRVLAGATSSFTENQVLEALESWLEKGLVIEQSDGYEFKHEQIQLTAYAGLNQSQCRQVHQEIARALTTLPLEPRLRDPTRLAYHYLNSHTPQQALPYLVASGQRALTLTALQEAQTLARQCLELLTAPGCNCQVTALTRSLQEALQPPEDIHQAYAILEKIVEI